MIKKTWDETTKIRKKDFDLKVGFCNNYKDIILTVFYIFNLSLAHYSFLLFRHTSGRLRPKTDSVNTYRKRIRYLIRLSIMVFYKHLNLNICVLYVYKIYIIHRYYYFNNEGGGTFILYGLFSITLILQDFTK